MSKHDSNQHLRLTPADLAPQSPAEAFQRFIELVRNSPIIFHADPEVLFSLLKPFLVNPHRDEQHVREIVDGYAAAKFGQASDRILRPVVWIANSIFRGTMESLKPNFIKRLHDLEASLRTELRPGSVSLHIKPVRFLDTPSGFGSKELHRYRVQVQTLIEPTEGDSLESVTIELTVTGTGVELDIDDVSPQAGFSVVELKAIQGTQKGEQETYSEKATTGVGITGGGAKISSNIEASTSKQVTTTVTKGGEQTLARVEQYLSARKIGNRAMWRALAGVGPIDAAGAEYTADILIPSNCREITICVDARAEWLRAGISPAQIQRMVSLPRPPSESDIVAS